MSTNNAVNALMECARRIVKEEPEMLWHSREAEHLASAAYHFFNALAVHKRNSEPAEDSGIFAKGFDKDYGAR